MPTFPAMIALVALAVTTAPPLAGSETIDGSVVTLQASWITETPSETHSSEGQPALYLTSDAVRLELLNEPVYILLRSQGQLLVLNSVKKTFMRLPVPVRFKDLAGAEGQRKLEQVDALLQLDVTAETSDESQRVSEWNCQETMIVTMSAIGKLGETTFCSSRDLPIDRAALRDALRAYRPLQLPLGQWIDHLLAVPDSVPLRWKRTSRFGSADGGHTETSWEIVSLSREAIAPDLFTVPEGYSQVPFEVPFKMIGELGK